MRPPLRARRRRRRHREDDGGRRAPLQLPGLPSLHILDPNNNNNTNTRIISPFLAAENGIKYLAMQDPHYDTTAMTYADYATAFATSSANSPRCTATTAKKRFRQTETEQKRLS